VSGEARTAFGPRRWGPVARGALSSITIRMASLALGFGQASKGLECGASVLVE
jgi:hypothetical protein